MIVDELDIVGIPGVPTEADPKLVVDPNAVLTAAVSGQGLETVSGWNPKILWRHGGVEHKQLSVSLSLKFPGKSAAPLAMEDAFRVASGEAPNHSPEY